MTKQHPLDYGDIDVDVGVDVVDDGDVVDDDDDADSYHAAIRFASRTNQLISQL